VSLGDDFGGIVNDSNCGLVVYRVLRNWQSGGPLLCVGHGFFWQILVVQVRKDPKVNHAECFIATGG